MCILILIIVMTFVFSSGSGDVFAHIGGFLAGMCVGLFLSPFYQNPATANQITLGSKYKKEDKIMMGVGIACYTLMVGLMLLLM